LHLPNIITYFPTGLMVSPAEADFGQKAWAESQEYFSVWF